MIATAQVATILMGNSRWILIMRELDCTSEKIGWELLKLLGIDGFENFWTDPMGVFH